MINERIIDGLEILTKEDAYLLINDVNERSITHRLGMYYQFIFTELHVDCEYNKNLGGNKVISINPYDFIRKMADYIEKLVGDDYSIMLAKMREFDITIEDLRYLQQQLRQENIIIDEEFETAYLVLHEKNGSSYRVEIIPDIIIHKRGSQHNLAVIEAKKSTNRRKSERLFDFIKLVALVNDDDYKYEVGYFVDIPCGNDFDDNVEFIALPYPLDTNIFLVKALTDN